MTYGATSMGMGYEMDDFRFYRRCLSQPEIAAWFNLVVA